MRSSFKAAFIGRFTTLTIFLLSAVFHATAFSFSPMTTSIAPFGSSAVVTYTVTNDSDQQAAVAIKVATRLIDASGVESNEPAEKQFLVFPARVVLQPNSSQNVKVQYRGDPAPRSELAFRVFAEQLPVDFSKSNASGVNILLTYVAALYVTPKNTAPRLSLSEASGVQEEGRQGLFVTVKNEGTKHALVANPILRIQPGSGTAPREFQADSLSGIDGQNLLPGLARSFFVPWDAAVPGATYEGSFDAEIE